MICQVLAVPPPAVRPSVKVDSQQRSEDDITHILVNIVKTNKTLQEKIQANANANISSKLNFDINFCNSICYCCFFCITVFNETA